MTWSRYWRIAGQLPAGHTAGTDERRFAPERRHLDVNELLRTVGAAAQVPQPAALVELAPRRVEQRGAERGWDGTAEHDDAQVEHRGRRRDRPPNHRAGAFDDRRRRPPQRAIRLCL